MLSEFDHYGGVDPLGFFPVFFRELASVVAPKLSMVIRRLLRTMLSPSQRFSANVVPIPIGAMAFL